MINISNTLFSLSINILIQYNMYIYVHRCCLNEIVIITSENNMDDCLFRIDDHIMSIVLFKIFFLEIYNLICVIVIYLFKL